MRIGILTLPLHTNYGGILQAWALQTVLERMGHEVYIIQKDQSPENPNPYWKRPLVYGKRIIKKAFWCHQTEIFVEKRLTKEYTYTCQHTNAFLHNNLNLFMVSSISKLRKDLFDAIVVGSDQIWRPKYIRTVLKEESRQAFLSFATSWKLRRIAYAASFGTDVWEYSDEETLLIQSLVKQFCAISVREDSGVRLCKDFLGVEATHVLDPTMLLNSEDYNMIAGTDGEKDGNLMCYILDYNSYKESVIHKLSVETGLTPFVSNRSQGNEPQLPVEQWLQGFYRSKMIITDSFHACAFSIIYKKPFFVIENKNRGNARIESLLTMFGLENRLIKEGEVITNELLCTPIDYSKVYLLLDKWRHLSYAFLNVHLGLS